jgi:ADP-ribose pyrophosphatase YjhB (NUDIX family)
MKREFPDHPLVGVGGVVVHRNRVLLIRRGGEPLKGEWSIPGGLLEVGEELSQAACRELKEETGLAVEPLEIVEVFDRIFRQGRRVRYHFVIVDYVCRLKGGRLRPASDVLEACWVRREDLGKFHLTRKATAVALRAFEYFDRLAKRQRAANQKIRLNK